MPNAARLFALLLIGAAVGLPTTAAVACEKHVQGHQHSSDTGREYSRQR
ncbi:MAG: hypothetical protein VKM98_09775 [Cyanobacteriota bacterium]|nr:hypothetical protein [Cyanobacteriota bacterium]